MERESANRKTDAIENDWDSLRYYDEEMSDLGVEREGYDGQTPGYTDAEAQAIEHEWKINNERKEHANLQPTALNYMQEDLDELAGGTYDQSLYDARTASDEANRPQPTALDYMKEDLDDLATSAYDQSLYDARTVSDDAQPKPVDNPPRPQPTPVDNTPDPQANSDQIPTPAKQEDSQPAPATPNRPQPAPEPQAEPGQPQSAPSQPEAAPSRSRFAEKPNDEIADIQNVLMDLLRSQDPAMTRILQKMPGENDNDYRERLLRVGKTEMRWRQVKENIKQAAIHQREDLVSARTFTQHLPRPNLNRPLDTDYFRQQSEAAKSSIQKMADQAKKELKQKFNSFYAEHYDDEIKQYTKKPEAPSEPEAQGRPATPVEPVRTALGDTAAAPRGEAAPDSGEVANDQIASIALQILARRRQAEQANLRDTRNSEPINNTEKQTIKDIDEYSPDYTPSNESMAEFARQILAKKRQAQSGSRPSTSPSSRPSTAEPIRHQAESAPRVDASPRRAETSPRPDSLANDEVAAKAREMAQRNHQRAIERTEAARQDEQEAATSDQNRPISLRLKLAKIFDKVFNKPTKSARGQDPLLSPENQTAMKERVRYIKESGKKIADLNSTFVTLETNGAMVQLVSKVSPERLSMPDGWRYDGRGFISDGDKHNIPVRHYNEEKDRYETWGVNWPPKPEGQQPTASPQSTPENPDNPFDEY